VKALVTGGAGFIGCHVVRELLEAGAEVRVLDDLSSGTRENLTGLSGPVEFTMGSVTDVETVRRTMEDCGAVFHLAAIASVERSIQDPDGTALVNLEGAKTVFAEAAVQRAKIVFSSTSAVYGDLAEVPLSERSETAPKSPYAAQKLEAERLLMGKRAVCLRYFNVYGPRQDPYSDYAAVVPKFAHAALEGLPLVVFGDGGQTRDFIFVQDVARANLLAFEASSQSAQTFNIGSGKSVTILELAEQVLRAAGSSSRIEFKSGREGEVRHSRADMSLAKQQLGFEAEVSLHDGLVRTLEYWRTAVS
jgi:UDP-glucose 4-epimerase